MSAVATSSKFKENAHDALTDARLQGAMSFSRNFVGRRAAAAARLPEFEALRDSARAIKDHTLAHLDLYLEAYEQKVRASGGEVHYAQDAEEARKIIIDLCRSMDAKSVSKGKSMIAEEINLNHALEGAGIEPIETDLGEYIIQLRGEGPSHIIAPAIHLTAKDIEQDFRKAHGDLLPERSLAEPEQLLAEARQVLRAKFLAADVGITGANFLVAETGTSIIVTNEGNGDLTQILPKAHIVIASLEKIVPTLEDAAQLLRVLARSATGQDASVYTTLSTGPRRPGDPDGPRAYHVVILDNGRSTMLGGEFEDMLRCIRCGACMNHCPVYQAVGGHAYGWVYPGPMGAVLTPSLIGVAEGGQLPNASTFCGRCEEVCPVRIPLPGMMRHWREREFERRLSPAPMRYGLGFWASPRASCISPAETRAASPPCPSPAAGRAIAILLRRRGRRSRASGDRGAERFDEFPGGGVRQHSALAWRHRRRSDAPFRGRNPPEAGATGRRAEARPGRRRDPGRDFQGRGGARASERNRGAELGGRAGGNRPLFTRKQLPGDFAHGRRSASDGHAVERDHARNPARPLRRPRSQRRLGRLCRDRRNRNARSRLRPG
jgi:L-lactate dehydrogenase complex protein LldF